MSVKIICLVVTMTCAVLGKEGTNFLLLSIEKKVTAKAK